MRHLKLIALNTKKRQWSLLVLLSLAVLLVVAPHPAHAQFTLVGNVIGNSIFLILANILIVVTKLFASLTGIFVSLLIVVARYNTFLKADVVMSGWPIVRDLMNMVFIIGLLIIAAGTVLRLQNYRYNRLLGKLIIMALLVNFSKFIAVFLLQFAQVVMLTFVNAFKDVAFANFSHMFGLDAVLNFSNEQVLKGGLTNESGANFSLVVTLLAGLAMMIISFVVILAICVVLFVRIIALWLLIILSPLAYALRVIPNTEKYASQWWSEFGKYATVGPVLAFFLWISLALVASGVNCATTDTSFNDKCDDNPLISQDVQTSAAFQQANTDTETLRHDFLSEALSLNRLVTFVVSIIFLIMGLNYAQKSGGAGGAFAGKVATAGFGAAATVTGLNAIRDRTIAPVQGWLKNRQAARQSAIQERTQTVEAAGDRARAALGQTRIGQAASRAPIFGAGVTRGTDRAEAAAAAYERQRTARTGQERGFENRSAGNLEQRMVTSTDQRERTAALQELQKRGRLDLTQPQVLAAFHDLTNPTGVNGRTFMADADRRKVREDAVNTAAETADWGQAQTMLPILTAMEGAKLLQGLNNRGRLNLADGAQRAEFDRVTNQGLGFGGLKEAERRKMRNDVVQKNAETMTPAQIRALMPTLTDPQERMLALQGLEKKRALNANNPADQTMVNSVRAGLAALPTDLKRFDDELKRSNPDMALQTIYNGLRTGLPDAQQLVSDIQQGIFSTAALSVRDVAAMSRSLRQGGMSKDDSQSWFGNQLLTNARSQEEYNRIMNGMKWQTRDIIHNDLQVDPAITPEKRKWLADQAYIGEAYHGNQNAVEYYIDNNSTQVLKNLRDERLSRATWGNEAAIERIIQQDRVGINDLVDATKNISGARDSATSTLRSITHRYNSSAQANVDDSNTEGRRQNKIRRSFVAVSGGGNVDDPYSMGAMPGGTPPQISSLEAAFKLGGAATTAALSGASAALERTINTIGNKLTKIQWSGPTGLGAQGTRGQVIQRAIIENLKVTHMADIDEKNPGLSKDIYLKIKDLDTSKPTAFGGRPLTPDDLKQIHDTLERIKKSERLPFG